MTIKTQREKGIAQEGKKFRAILGLSDPTTDFCDPEDWT